MFFSFRCCMLGGLLRVRQTGGVFRTWSTRSRLDGCSICTSNHKLEHRPPFSKVEPKNLDLRYVFHPAPIGAG